MKIKNLVEDVNSIKFHKCGLIINLNGDDKYCGLLCDLIHEHIPYCSSEDNWTKKGNIYVKFKFNDENDYNKAVDIIESSQISY
jgi:hypothetical protein